MNSRLIIEILAIVVGSTILARPKLVPMFIELIYISVKIIITAIAIGVIWILYRFEKLLRR